jgi:hypothetical protein
MILLPFLVLWPALGLAMTNTLSREEVDGLWEQLLREERYEALSFEGSRSSTPNVHKFKEKRIVVYEAGEGYLWGLFGLSDGGGWRIEGQLEVEIPIEQGVLQLYSKETSKWRPGLAVVWMPGYDPNKYPIREFRLILRDLVRRQQIQPLKSFSVFPEAVLPTDNSDGTSVTELLGQRIPRGELQYDKARHVAVMKILGLRNPITLEVPIPRSPGAPASEGR